VEYVTVIRTALFILIMMYGIAFPGTELTGEWWREHLARHVLPPVRLSQPKGQRLYFHAV